MVVHARRPARIGIVDAAGSFSASQPGPGDGLELSRATGWRGEERETEDGGAAAGELRLDVLGADDG